MNAIAALNEFGVKIAGTTHALGISDEASRHLLIAIRCIEDDDAIAIEHVKKAMLLLEPPSRLDADISASCATAKLAAGGLAPWQVNRIASYVSANIAGQILLADLSRLVNLSASYFSSVFKASFGVSPHNYVLQQRIEYAKNQMLLTESSFSEIALACGLSDQAHLSRTFRRITGMTPSAWRRSIRRKHGEGAHRLAGGKESAAPKPEFDRSNGRSAGAV